MLENLAGLDLPILEELKEDLIGAARASEHRRIVSIAAHKRYRLVGAGALALVAAVVALTVGLSLNSSTQPALALPVLRRPATDASNIRSRTEQLVQTGADFQDAHAISTAYGPGYVMPAANATKLCLAIPDPVDGYGVGCSTIEEAKEHGLYSMIVSQNSTELVVVLPASASNPVVLHTNGTSSTLELSEGIGVLVISEDVTVRLRVDDAQTSVHVPAHRGTECHSVPAQPGDGEHGHFTRELCKEP